MKKTVAPLIAAFFILALPIAVFAASDVPQKIIDMRSSIVRVIAPVQNGYSMGTGFAIGEGEPVEYIVTNYHVIEQNTGAIEVWYNNKTIVQADVAAEMPESDLCVLKLKDPIAGMAPFTLDNRNDAQVGQNIYTMGFPGSADVFSNELTASAQDVTITDGIISSMKSAAIIQKGTDVRLYQINAAISPGNSGGPLMNDKAEVIGINSYAAQNAQNINAAINIGELTALLDQNGIPYKISDFWTENMLLIFIAGAAILAVLVTVIVVLARKKIRNESLKNIPLEKFLIKAGGRLPFETAVGILEPVVKKLARMHATGISHLDICPGKVYVNRKTHLGFLQKPGKWGGRELSGFRGPHEDFEGYSLLICPGYSPLEMYKTNGDIGTWTDVYSVGAVLYLMVNGKNPPDALSRMDNDVEVLDNIEEHNLSESRKQAWLRAMSLSVQGRIQNCDMLEAELFARGEDGKICLDVDEYERLAGGK
jgi:hypothetical protein